MATELDLFYKSPSEKLFDNLTIDQLLEVADKYEIPLNSKDKQLKRTVAVIVKAALVNLDILSVGEFAAGDNDGADQIAANVLSLSFEQQRDLMLLEIEKFKLNREVEVRRLEVEAMRFQLIGEGKLGGSFVGLNVSGNKVLDVAKNVKLLPKFCETDVDFFCLFECLADVMKWPENEQTLLLQCVLTGKAQKAYSSLSVHDSQKYLKVKDAVLKAFELVPEAYRQKFRNLRKPAEQTCCEFGRDLKIQLDRWCAASGTNNLEDFHELFLLEQFKSTLPEHISTFLADRNVTSTEDAAILTDEFVLTHKCEVKKGRFKFSDVPTEGVTVPRQVLSEHHNRGERNWKSYADKSDCCAYCHLKGHWKKDCLALKGKLMRVKSEHKSVLVVSSVQIDESDVPIDTLQKLEKSGGIL